MAEQQNTPAGESIEEILHEHLGFVRIYASIAQQYIEIGDLAGFKHSMRQLTGRVRFVAGTWNDREKHFDRIGGSE